MTHSPHPLHLPPGPIWACNTRQAAGYPLSGKPAKQLRDASLQLLQGEVSSAPLRIPLNPWAGGEPSAHQLQLLIHRLTPDCLSVVEQLEHALHAGRVCEFRFSDRSLRCGQQQLAPLPPQATAVGEDGKITFSPTDSAVAVFGAGALAHHVVSALSDTPTTVHWIAAAAERCLPRVAANVCVHDDGPGTFQWLPENCHCLVITHDHARDLQLSATLALRSQVASVGMVGSPRKAARLQHALSEQQLPELANDKIRCPIGGGNTHSLHAATVAIAHEVLQLCLATSSA